MRVLRVSARLRINASVSWEHWAPSIITLVTYWTASIRTDGLQSNIHSRSRYRRDKSYSKTAGDITDIYVHVTAMQFLMYFAARLDFLKRDDYV